jgi:Flp pilus assembly pilin Flp
MERLRILRTAVGRLATESNDGGQGQGLAEYALILALIAIIAIIALVFLGGQISTIISDIGHSI